LHGSVRSKTNCLTLSIRASKAWHRQQMHSKNAPFGPRVVRNHLVLQIIALPFAVPRGWQKVLPKSQGPLCEARVFDLPTKALPALLRWQGIRSVLA
jgi:hypothetical protein